MLKKLSYLLYRLIKWVVWVCYPYTRIVGVQNLPDESCIVVGNHAKTNGPVACELYFPVERYTWCNGEMMHLKEVPEYTYQDFWSKKPKSIRWLYRIASYLIAPLSVCIFNNANCIGVYHDLRIMETFKETVQKLQSDDGRCNGLSPRPARAHRRAVSQYTESAVSYKQSGLVSAKHG